MTYYDLYVPVSMGERFREIVEFERRLGFSVFAATVEVSGMADVEKKLSLLDSYAEGDPRFYTRIDVVTGDVGVIRELIRRVRGLVDLVSVTPLSIQAFRAAGRDRRVDIISVDLRSSRWIDRSQARLMKESGSVVEIVFSRLLSNKTSRALNILRRVISFSEESGTPMMVSIGAREVFETRHPRQILHTLYLMGASVVAARNAVSIVPALVVKRTRHRRSGLHVAEGVDLLEG